MKFTPSPIAGQMSGSAGSLVASRNRFGSYFRTKVIPVNPNTIRQQAVRTFFTTLVVLWGNTLDDAQRALWEQYAEGVPIRGEILTGQNHYIRSNVPRLQIGATRIDAAPTILDTGAPVTSIEVLTDPVFNTLGVNLAADGYSSTFNVVGGASDDGDIIFYLGNVIGTAINFYKGPYQLVQVLPIAEAATSADLTALFTAAANDNGDPITGQRRGVRARVMYDDGRLSDAHSSILPVLADST